MDPTSWKHPDNLRLFGPLRTHRTHRRRQAEVRPCVTVEVRGFEPLTSSVRGKRSAGLSYTPIEGPVMIVPFVVGTDELCQLERCRSRSRRRRSCTAVAVRSDRDRSTSDRATSVVRRRLEVIPSG